MSKIATDENIKHLLTEIVDQMVIKSGAAEQIGFLVKEAADEFENIESTELRDLAAKTFTKLFNKEKYDKDREKIEKNYQLIDSLGVD